MFLRENDKIYYLDAVNKLILELLENNDFKQINIGCCKEREYRDSNVERIGKVLTKYYELQKLGVDYVYDY